MLVLSRRAKDKISFPEVGITVHFIRIQSGTAKIGIDAPMQIQIVRNEVCPDQATDAENLRSELLRLPRQVRHAIRNELHAVSVGTHLLREQLHLGMKDDAQETFETIQESLQRLDDNQVLQRPQNVPNVPTTSERGTVLVVEDQANERELLARLLSIKGYEVAIAGDGNEALEYLATHDTPKVILMDMNLPRCDGASAVRKIRANSEHGDARVFAVSGSSPENNELEIGRQGIDRWFSKPVNTDSLLNAIAHAASDS